MKFLLDTNAFSDLMRKHSRLHKTYFGEKNASPKRLFDPCRGTGRSLVGSYTTFKGLLAPIRQKLTTLLVVRTAYGTGSQRKRW